MGSPSTGAAHGRSSALIPSAIPRPLTVPGLTNNGFKDRRLALQIITILSNVLHPRSRAARKTVQEVTHPKIAPQQARLTVDFLKVDFPKRKAHLW